ncbi:cobalamin-binding protein [Flaviaesturariibacter flavus]|uniref:Cobalamin-binding protein n=1 Tax=Flaviaesturariibacter flavus TaxID=2502780 RepID=A0A4R1BA38_9BACT|nr:helical backbone metal receptor [Flaviaesturariibacter flavus]TCJ13784.1 cobalamin-binding protein [Flaviaesturariibacter flavus]
MIRLTDPFGKPLNLPDPPQRIVSLVPSQTELLYDLGLEDEVVGITKFCVHPEEWFREKPRVGGTKTINPDRVRELRPDLVLANKEENVREQVEALAAEFPTWSSDIATLEDAIEAIRAIGSLVHRDDAAKTIVTRILDAFEELDPIFEDQPDTAYLIWKDPYMTAGGDTFIHDMLTRLGVHNIFEKRKRYPEVTVAELRGCELLLLSSEPYPFKQEHIDELQARLPETKILLVDGELFSWYGSRLLKTPAYFEKLRAQLGIE